MKATNDAIYRTLSNNLSIENKVINSSIRKAKLDFYNREFDKNKNDIKKTWDTISDVLNKSKLHNEFPTYFNIDGNRISNVSDIASHFNDFFINIGPNLARNINEHGKLPYTHYLNSVSINSRFKFNYVDESEISKIIRNIKPKYSTGYDNISTILLKLSGSVLLKPLTAIINQSLHSGVFPQKLKIAKVIPIFKKDDPHSLTNYRPISLLPAISKIFEKVAHAQLLDYFTKHNLLYPHQYGFREGHSTELALTEFLDRLYKLLDNKKTPFAIYIDLSKAFDTLDHSILLSKLQHYGISNTELNWFSSYLNNRKQYVELQGETSDMSQIKTGVPQGSILGPFLFLIYINDLYLASNFVSIMFADDTTLLSTFCNFQTNINQNVSVLSKNINLELSKVYDWLCVNKLSLNIQKTKAMIFSFKQSSILRMPKLMIENTEVEVIENFKFLGVYINRNLDWKFHIDYIANKLSRINGMICRLKHLLPKHILRMIYSALFQPHLNYGITAWGFAPSSATNRIRKLQKKVIRNVTKSRYNSHTAELFKNLHILKFNDLLNTICLNFFYKYENDMLPSYFQNVFKPIRNNINRPIRNRQAPNRLSENVENIENEYLTKYPIIHTNTISARNCLRHNLINMLHTRVFHQNIITKVYTHSYEGLSKYSKNTLINSYKTICVRQNCPSCRPDPNENVNASALS
jgi:hypothetical protein